MTERTARWEQPGYSDITRARGTTGELEVVFANGDRVLIPFSAVDVHVSGDVSLEIIDDGLAIRIGEGDATTEVSWVRLRSVTDPRYAQYLGELDAQESRRLGQRLKALREDRGLKLEELAHDVGMSASQLSKIEKGDFRIEYATVRMLLHRLGATLADISGPHALDVSVRTLVQRAVKGGVSRELASALARAVPRHLVPDFLATAFAWSKEAFLRGIPETPRLVGSVQFKALSGQPPIESPSVHLAFSVARLARTAFTVPAYRSVPPDPRIIHQAAVDGAGQVTLASLLDWAWRQGIPVLPLSGAGPFAAAVFDGDESPTIIIKDARQLAVIWLFDLAHELGHVALGHVHRALIDVRPSPEPLITDRDEQTATEFALELLLPNYKELLKEIRDDARGDGVRFKFAVERVARDARLTPGVLGLAAAFALPEIGLPKDRWGSATNLAKPLGIGREQTLIAARSRAQLEVLPQLDAALIRTAVLNEIH